MSIEGIPAPRDRHNCSECHRDISRPGKGQRRIIVKYRGSIHMLPASDVVDWVETVSAGGSRTTDWDSLTWKREGYTFLKWVNRCNDCYIDMCERMKAAS